MTRAEVIAQAIFDYLTAPGEAPYTFNPNEAERFVDVDGTIYCDLLAKRRKKRPTLLEGAS